MKTKLSKLHTSCDSGRGWLLACFKRAKRRSNAYFKARNRHTSPRNPADCALKAQYDESVASNLSRFKKSHNHNSLHVVQPYHCPALLQTVPSQSEGLRTPTPETSLAVLVTKKGFRGSDKILGLRV